MKPFNLQEFFAHPSIKVVTRDGNPVKILCTDARSKRPIVALVEDDDCDDYLFTFLPDGKMYYRKEGPNDLFFVTKNRAGWVNIYKIPDTDELEASCIFSTKDEAEFYRGDNPNYVATTKITWEE